ncbi:MULTISPECIES: hypothetical protein [Enterococcus]|uniref:hypothetical protein n=1 Tax=Enterococcus TaxID=1350 RepID=UPI0003A2A5CE|nr:MULTISPECIES: hypothetical protein [Enterococcus]MBS5820933.1 hypothetical protein [Enterococcus gilvus]MDN6004397.1 hypothetical protein [Enterococcus sp.]MDN6217226.1 hypothetical protein [Enterococcus sp.]MDN6561670.1 hypothetical protein [Enterococcus sp.]MDN6777162.1 hypothetical protein [Enterococcus sp.]
MAFILVPLTLTVDFYICSERFFFGKVTERHHEDQMFLIERMDNMKKKSFIATNRE